jgi:YHS domain-containing protein
MKRSIFLSLILIILFSAALKPTAQEKPKKAEVKTESVEEVKIWNKYCPIRGGEVDPETPTVEYKGKVIGFCCPGCDEKFVKDPEKYLKNLSEDGQEFIGKTK